MGSAKENIMEKKTSTTSTSSFASVRRTSRQNKYIAKGIDDEDVDDDDDDSDVRGLGGESLAGFESLQKYRPCNYEFAAPKETDDINDLRDYYTNLNTRQRAMQRVVSVGNEPGPFGGRDNDYGSTMSDRTRSLLKNVRQSTNALSDLTADEDGPYRPSSNHGAGRRRSTQMSGARLSNMKYDQEEEVGRLNGNPGALQSQENWPQPEDQGQPPIQMGMPPEQPSYPAYGSAGYQRGYEPDFYDRLSYGNDQQQYSQHPQPPGSYGYMPSPYSNPQGVGGYQMGGYPQPNGYQNGAGRGNPSFNGQGYGDADIDPTTKLILSRARDVYNTTNYHMDDYKKQKDNDRRSGGHGSTSFARGGRNEDLNHLRPSPPKQSEEIGSMMSEKTRALLQNVKHSTSALADMTVEEDVPFRSSGKPPARQSRFLRKQESEAKDYSPPRGVESLRQMDSRRSPVYVSRLADDVLGESNYPPLDDHRRASDTRRPTYEPSYSTLPSRKTSAPAGQDYSFERNRSPPSLRDNYNTRRQDNHDDDDIDAYISNLKQKTSGRDMIKVVSEIEGRRVTPPRASRERDENGFNDYGGSRQRREGSRNGGGRDEYSYQGNRSANNSSYNKNNFSSQDRSYNGRGREQDDQPASNFSGSSRREMSTDRTRLRSSSISRRGSFQADSSDLMGSMSSRNRYGKEDSSTSGPFGGSGGPISSRKQPYLKSYR